VISGNSEIRDLDGLDAEAAGYAILSWPEE